MIVLSFILKLNRQSPVGMKRWLTIEGKSDAANEAAGCASPINVPGKVFTNADMGRYTLKEMVSRRQFKRAKSDRNFEDL